MRAQIVSPNADKNLILRYGSPLTPALSQFTGRDHHEHLFGERERVQSRSQIQESTCSTFCPLSLWVRMRGVVNKILSRERPFATHAYVVSPPAP